MATLWPDGSSGQSPPRVTSEYGYRTHPVTGLPSTFHYGIDLIGWSLIKAARAGQVIFAGYNGGAGNEVRLRGDDGVVYRYLHNRELWVRAGQWVGQGQDLAVMGTTGSSTGVHCHYQIEVNGSTVNPRDFMWAANKPATPSGGGSKPLPDNENEEIEMNTCIYWTRSSDKQIVYAIINTDSGYVSQWFGSDSAYNNRMAAAFRTGNFVPVTESHANNLINSAIDVAPNDSLRVEVVDVSKGELASVNATA